ncbi:unnamed protein product [Notodromas monacha]|uniref:Uncharacterized protein n=1 Tax=Notodromas monacha TaxID=399045 RepID=A0A7R9C0I2_9CRUS|nr:unnamed protein product [Notodromas monacha]CAG0924065.1 unnamed protein product [Notodromas monacha]
MMEPLKKFQLKALIHVDFVAHEDFSFLDKSVLEKFEEVKKLGMFLEANIPKGMSTKDIIDGIIEEYRKDPQFFQRLQHPVPS